jgi:hypothetical protein
MDRVPGKLPNTISRLIAMAAPPWRELDRLVTLVVFEQKKMIESKQ